MDTFLYFHTRTWETFWLLVSWSEEHWVSLVSDPLWLGHDSLFIQYQPVPKCTAEAILGRVIFSFCFVLSFRKTSQFNMWIRKAHQWFIQSLLGNNSTSHQIFWVLHVYSQPFWSYELLWTVVYQYNICLWDCVSNWTRFSVLMCKVSSSVAVQATNCAFHTYHVFKCSMLPSLLLLVSFEVQWMHYAALQCFCKGKHPNECWLVCFD